MWNYQPNTVKSFCVGTCEMSDITNHRSGVGISLKACTKLPAVTNYQLPWLGSWPCSQGKLSPDKCPVVSRSTHNDLWPIWLQWSEQVVVSSDKHDKEYLLAIISMPVRHNSALSHFRPHFQLLFHIKLNIIMGWQAQEILYGWHGQKLSRDIII